MKTSLSQNYLMNQVHCTLSFCVPLVAQILKNLPAMWETWVQSLGWKDPLEKGMATHSSILACKIPWTQRSLVGYYCPRGHKESDTMEWLTLLVFLDCVYKAWWDYMFCLRCIAKKILNIDNQFSVLSYTVQILVNFPWCKSLLAQFIFPVMITHSNSLFINSVSIYWAPVRIPTFEMHTSILGRQIRQVIQM